MPHKDSVTISRLADAAGVNVETIRFYQRKGLLSTPRRPPRQIRRYGRNDIERVKFVKAAQRLGFSLAEVIVLLRLASEADCDAARMIAEQKLVDVRARMRDLRRVETALDSLISDCCSTSHPSECALIEALRSDKRAS